MAKKVIKVTTADRVEAEVKKYELMLVLQPEMLETAVEKKLKEFDKFLSEHGGEATMKDIWGKKRLAYRIKLFNEGI